MFRKIVSTLAILAAGFLHAEQDNVLLWWFDDPEITEIGGATVSAADIVGRGEAAGLTIDAVRVTATDAEGNKVYLNLSDTTAQEGARDNWQSWMSLPDGDGDYYAGPGYADLVGLNLDPTGLTFAMELGTFIGSGDDLKWVVLAGSEGSTLRELMDGGHIVSSELSVQGTVDWSASGYSVPEPSSGLLVLVGGALLALRRRRKGEAV